MHLNEYLSTYYVPGTVLGAKFVVVDKIASTDVIVELTFY